MTLSIIRRIAILLMTVWAILITSVALTATPSAFAQSESGDTVVDHDLTIDSGQTLQGDVKVNGGDLTVYGIIQGTANVVDGNADISGQVLGDLTVLGDGNITLGEGSFVDGNVISAGNIEIDDNSHVTGSVTSLGGNISVSESAIVDGTTGKIDNPAQAIENFINSNMPHTSGSPSNLDEQIGPFSRFFGWIGLGIFSAIVLTLAVGLTALVPRRIRVSSVTLESEPGPSVVVGVIAALLIFPVFGIATMALAITVVGIVLIPVLALAVFLAFLFGFVVVSQWLGKRLYENVRPNDSPFELRQSQSTAIVIEVLLGASVILASMTFPAIFLPGWITAMLLGIIYLVSCIGIGSAILSKLGTLQPPRRNGHRRTIIYPTPVHNHYGSALPHTPVHVHGNTRPLGPVPTLPKEE